MKNLGTFHVFNYPEPYPDQIKPLIKAGVIFFHNENQTDFYSLHDETGTFVAVSGDLVSAVVDDISKLTPEGLTIYQLEDGEVKPDIGMILKDGSFSKPAEKLGTITKRQFKLEMIELEKDDDLEKIIAAMSIKDQKKIRAELDANEYHFESPFVSQLALALGFSEEEKVKFWKEAAQR